MSFFQLVERRTLFWSSSWCDHNRYVQGHFGWAAADIVITAVIAFSILVFCVGRPCYRFRKLMRSPLTPLLKFLVAAISNRNLPYPSQPDLLYEVPKSDKDQDRLLSFEKLKFLDKAAIIEDGKNSSEKQHPWRLATVTKVEETKLIINMIPIWQTTPLFGIYMAQGTIFFIKQSTTLDRKIAPCPLLT